MTPLSLSMIEKMMLFIQMITPFHFSEMTLPWQVKKQHDESFQSDQIENKTTMLRLFPNQMRKRWNFLWLYNKKPSNQKQKKDQYPYFEPRLRTTKR